MKPYIIVLFLFGIAEIASNLIHLSKGKPELIGQSAKRQHQELSLALGNAHFYYKAIVMFVFGILFVGAGSIAFLSGCSIGLGIVSALFGLYGLWQALYYKRPYKVWTALAVYLLPALFYVLLQP